jgi:hypothetical protein
MTMFAILRLSRGLNGLGDFDILLLVERGDPDDGENCISGKRILLDG